MIRVYERDTDALFLRSFRMNPTFSQRFAEIVADRNVEGTPNVRGQVKHRQGTGTIDLEVRWPDGLTLLIENKIDAGYSVTRLGEGQVDRYRKSAEALREGGVDAKSILLAPKVYLSRTAASFDVHVSYEDLRSVLSGADIELLERAIDQASVPYEATPDVQTTDFFLNYKNFAAHRYPTLFIKPGPNANGVRPSGSHTIYFEVLKTLVRYEEFPRPRMSLQCWDSGAPSASVKIMIGEWGSYATKLKPPVSLRDIGGYLRRANRSLGIVIDTPRLDTQKPFDEQLPEVVEGLEAAARLQAWWAGNRSTLQNWNGLICV